MSQRKKFSRDLDALELVVLRMIREYPGRTFARWQTRFRGAADRLKKLGMIERVCPRGGWKLAEDPAAPVPATAPAVETRRGWDGW